MTIGEELQRLMEERGIKNYMELARLSGVSYHTIKSAEFRKHTQMQRRTAEKLEKALGVEKDHLRLFCIRNKSLKPSVWKKRFAEKTQLCWHCRNAVPDEHHGCSWSRDFQPVKGWTAEPSLIGWYITGCPKFKEG